MVKKKTTPKKPPTKRTFANKPPPFAVVGGEQHIVDPILVNARNFYAGLRHGDKLHIYHALIRNQPLAIGAVNVIKRMINQRPIFNSGDPEVDRRSKQIWQEVKGRDVNAQLIHNGLTYGYSAGEIVYPTMEILPTRYPSRGPPAPKVAVRSWGRCLEHG